MSSISLFRALEGLDGTAIEGASLNAEGELVIRVRPLAKRASRCGRCQRRSSRYDAGQRHTWRCCFKAGDGGAVVQRPPRAPLSGVVAR